jgi:hypothetical protein
MRITVPYCEFRWEFPYDRFVEYEQSDEGWARQAGFGKESIEIKYITLDDARIVSQQTTRDYAKRSTEIKTIIEIPDKSLATARFK